MATSESSSAVLDLNDADVTEDTEAPSVTECTNDGVPLIMEHGYDIAVKVDAPMKQLSTLETYVTYRVRCVCARWPTPNHVRRRYNHFKVLHKRLSMAHPLIAPPALPPLHSARQQLDRYSPTFVAIRALALDYFLGRVAKHPILTHSEHFRIFLTMPDEEFDKTFKSENSALNLWGLSSAFYGSNETKPTNGARVKDPEFTSASEYLTSLQHKLCTLCSLTAKLYKGSAALGIELMNMKRVCDAWSCQSGGRAGSACGACGAGAGGAALSRRLPPAAPARPAATLPLLAAYAAAHAAKIKQRDAVHAAHVAGNSTDDLHNKLEQASEALRSELSDWIPKTRSEINYLLLDVAERQVNVHTQTLMSWENALKMSSETSVNELFKTVSKSAVQNLSPSKFRASSPSETEKDLDDIDIDDCSDVDLDTPKVEDGSTLDNDEYSILNQDSEVKSLKLENGDTNVGSLKDSKDTNEGSSKDTNEGNSKNTNEGSSKNTNGGSSKDTNGGDSKDTNGGDSKDTNGGDSKDTNGGVSKDSKYTNEGISKDTSRGSSKDSKFTNTHKSVTENLNSKSTGESSNSDPLLNLSEVDLST